MPFKFSINISPVAFLVLFSHSCFTAFHSGRLPVLELGNMLRVIPDMLRTLKSIPMASVLVFLIVIAVLPGTLMGEPRAQIIEIMCKNQLLYNTTLSISNFIESMESISDQMRMQGWGMYVRGSGADTNYGLSQCYGDLSLLDCALCYAEARTTLPECFPSNGGRIFFDGCFMRTENYSFFQEYTGSWDHAVCGNRTRKDSVFEQIARRAVSQAVSLAPNNSGYARAELPVLGAANASAYVLANCWKTISNYSCKSCLENASASILGCLPWSEGRALNTGCFMRYSDTNFLNPIPGNSSSRGNEFIIIVAVVCSVVLVLGAVIGYCIWKRRKLRKRKGVNEDQKLAMALRDGGLECKYSTLKKATGSFDDANKLGQGGFGTVYKGILPDGKEVAVKRLFFNVQHKATDFYNEVRIISSIRHKNLVRLLGCSGSGPESLLVYELLPNGSLERFIFDPKKGKELDWAKRFNIIIGTAEGLVYLHGNTETRIVHRDIKASNILLDSKLQVKIADFGLARSFEGDKSHISTAIAGTLGYMAPEYIGHGQLTEKADVYSFGVLLLEIVTGRQNNRNTTLEYSESLVTMMWKHFQQGRVQELFDKNLSLDDNIEDEMLRVVHVGLLCTQKLPGLRPTMSTALQMLSRKDEHLPPPTLPPYIDGDELNIGLGGLSDPTKCDDLASNASMSHTTFYPR